MHEMIKKYFESALKEKKSFVINLLFDFIANMVSMFVIYVLFLLFSQVTNVLYPKFITNFNIVNKIVILLLVLWGSISGIILIANYIRVLFIIDNNLRNRVDEEKSI